LLGTFDSNNAAAAAGWQLARTWTVGLVAHYTIIKNVTPLFVGSIPGGHGISGAISAQHTVSEHLGVEFGYARFHQSYAGIAAIAEDPDSDRVYVSVSYGFRRPMGR
jgi:hypothetical protein